MIIRVAECLVRSIDVWTITDYITKETSENISVAWEKRMIYYMDLDQIKVILLKERSQRDLYYWLFKVKINFK